MRVIRDIILLIIFFGALYLFRNIPTISQSAGNFVSYVATSPLSEDKSTVGEKQEKERVVLPLIVDTYSVVIWDITTGEVLYEKNASWQLPVASLAKLMTALVAIEESSLNDEIVVSHEAVQEEESSGELVAGEVLTLEQLLHTLLITSSNDAAGAIAEYAGGRLLNSIFPGQNFQYEEKLDTFVVLMNRKAEQLGMADTYFQTPTGLDRDGQYSSAEDLKKLIDYLWRNHRQILIITGHDTFTTIAKNGKLHTWENTNLLIKEDGAIRGGKTGFTKLARGSLFIFWDVGPDRTLAALIIGSNDRFGEMKKIIKWSKDR